MSISRLWSMMLIGTSLRPFQSSMSQKKEQKRHNKNYTKLKTFLTAVQSPEKFKRQN